MRGFYMRNLKVREGKVTELSTFSTLAESEPESRSDGQGACFKFYATLVYWQVTLLS